MLDHYQLHMQASGLAERTVADRIQMLTLFVKGRRFEQIERRDVVKFLADTRYAPGTRSNYFSNLRLFFDWMIAEGYRDDHPMIGLKKPRKPPSVPHPVTNEQFAQILASRMRPGTRRAIMLAAYAGLRVHEICKLDGDDYQGGRLLVKGKGGRTDEIPVPMVLAAALEGMPRSGLWFESPKYPGKPMNRQGMSTMIGRAIRRAGVNATAHSLRHWYATTLLREGVDIRVVQSLMRHASLQTTAGYLAITSSARIEAVEQLPLVA